MTSAINNFSAILAASIHDIKNSLINVRNLIDQLARLKGFTDTPEFRSLESEANRMQGSLVQLLILYKIDAALFSPTIDEYPVADILYEVAAQQSDLILLNGIELSVECFDESYCYCDSALIVTVLISALNNAQRYCRKKIILSAEESDGLLCFQVEDDGKGYPESVSSTGSTAGASCARAGENTGLGLFFARAIADLHVNGERHGFVKIDNESRLGGARFRLFLP